MFGSTGHTFLEMHYFFLLEKKLNLKKYYYFLFMGKSKFAIELKEIFPNFFISNKNKPTFKLIIINKYLEYFLNIIFSLDSKFTTDIGLGHYRNGRTNRTPLDGFNRYIDYYKRCNRNKLFINKKIFSSESSHLRKKLGIHSNDIIVNIHLKEAANNACALKTNPSSYIEVIKYLKKKGYKIVFIGREKMPKIFEKYSVINYANSKLANVKNDLLITYMSSFNICFASGIFSIANILNKPILYLGSWHLNIQTKNSNCIYFPAVLKNKTNKTFVYYTDQIKYVMNVNRLIDFKKKKIKVINPSSNDILYSFKELENLVNNKYKKTTLQKKFNKKFYNHPQQFSQSVVSKKFLSKYYNKVFNEKKNILF